MKTLVVSALALTAMSSAALAEPAQLTNSQSALALAATTDQSALAVASARSAGPVALTEAQLDTVSAGQVVGPINVLNVGAAVGCVIVGTCDKPTVIGNNFNQPAGGENGGE